MQRLAREKWHISEPLGVAALLVFLSARSAFPIAISNDPDPNVWGVDGIILSIVSAGNVVYVGGSFTNLLSPDGVTTLPASNLAAFSADTGQPTSWRPFTDGTVYALAASLDDSTIYVAGAFSNINSVARSGFAAIAPNGDLLWSADANSNVKALAVWGNSIFLGGNFTRVAGETRLRLAAIQPPPAGGTNAVVLPWAPSLTSTNGQAPAVNGLAAANGDIVAVGAFTHANGTSEKNQARFDAITGSWKTWESNVVYEVLSITTDGHNFYGGFAGKSGGRMVAWTPDGTEIYRAGGNGDFQAINFCARRLLVGGHFTKILGVFMDRLVAMNTNATLDTSWDPAPNAGGDRGVWALSVGAKVYVGGAFGQMGTNRARSYAQFSVTDTELPTTPTNFSAVAISPIQVDVAWDASSDDITVNGYNFYRNGLLLASLRPTTRYTDANVVPGQTYAYQVRARDGVGNFSDPSPTVTVNVPTDTQAPTVPKNVTAVAASATQVDVNWKASTDDVGLQSYDLYRNGTVLPTIGPVTNYTDSALLPLTTYNYKVLARDFAGNLSALSSNARVTTPADLDPPSQPIDLSAAATSATRIDLDWTASSDNVVVTGYDIYRDGVLLATAPGGTNYADTTVGPLTSYSYQIYAHDGAGNLSAPSDIAEATTPADTTPPADPTNLTANAVNVTTVNLAWNAAIDDVGVTGYDVHRDSSLLAALGVVASYSDTSAAPATTFSYQTFARDIAGNVSGGSNPAQATTPPDINSPTVPQNIAGVVVGPTQIDLNWNASTDNVAVVGYEIVRNGALLTTIGAVPSFSDTGLLPLTTYNYRVRARDGAGNVSGQSAKVTLTTSSDTTPPAPPSSVIASAAGSTRIDLAWSVASDNVGVTGYQIHRNEALLANLGAVTNYSDATVTPLTSYGYQVRARDAAGNFSGPASAPTVVPPDSEPPTAPSNLTATPVSLTRINLAWSASVDNAGVAGYQVYRNGALLITLGVVTSYADTSAAPGTTYNFQVRGRDGADNLSDPSNTATASTPADTNAPTKPQNFIAVASSSTQVDLNWKASTDNVAVAGYDILRNNVVIGSIGAITNYSDTTTAPLTTGNYKVRARDTSGNLSSPSSTIAVTTPADTTAPAPPANLAATPMSATRVDLMWDPATDNVGVTGYEVYRDGSLLASLGAVANYSDTTGSPVTSYNYEARARDGVGNVSDPSNSATATTLDTEAPTAPGGVQAAVTGATRVDLSWDAATDNVAVIAYDLYRDGSLLGSTVATNYSDMTASPLTGYSYQVRARDAAGNISTPSNTANATTPADTTPPVMSTNLIATAASATQIDLTWDSATDDVGVVGYDVYRDDALLTSLVAVTNYTDSTVTPLTSYNYGVRARDGAGNVSDPSNTATAMTSTDMEAPGAPANLAAAATGPSEVILTWDASTDNVGVVGYDLYRNGLLRTNLGPVTNHVDTADSSTTYSYELRARDAADNVSDPSNPAGATTPAETEPPTAPANLEGSAASSTQIDLTWVASTDNHGVAAYDIYREDALLTSIAPATNFSDTSVAPLMTYNYQVRARDAAGNTSDPSNTAPATTPGDAIAPSAPGNLTAAASSVTQIDLNWLASTDNVGVTGYDIYREGTLLVSLGATTSYADSTVAPSTAHGYEVRARDAAGNASDPSNTATEITPADTEPPTSPANLSASATSATQVNLNWLPATDNVGVTAYNVYRGGSLIASLALGTAYSDTTAAPSTTHSYTIHARDAAGNLSSPSNTASATTPADTQTPSTPTGLLGSPISATRVDLRWAAATDNAAVTAYRISRQGVILATIGAVTNFSDTTVSPLTTYDYKVRALDAAGNPSPWSVKTTVTTPADTEPPAAPPDLTGIALGLTRVDLDWDATTDNVGVTGYDVYRDSALLISLGNVTAHSDTTVTGLQTYLYEVRARDAAGNISDPSDAATITTSGDSTPPTAPTNLTAVVVSPVQVDLSWGAATDDVQLAGYNLYRDGELTDVVGVLTNYSDTSVLMATAYQYEVRARDDAGNLSESSNAAMVTTPDPEPPTAPANLTANATGATHIDLNWTASSDNASVAAYQIHRDGSLLTTIGAVTNFADTTVVPLTTHSYEVRAKDTANNLSDPSNTAAATTPADTTPPVAPIDLTATPINLLRIDLGWTAVTDDVGVTAYDVYRDGTLLATLGAVTSYSDVTVAPSTAYNYHLRVHDAVGNLSEPSNSAGATTPADGTQPSVPQNPTGTAVSSGQIDLAWDASTDNVGVVGYNVYREGSLVASLGAVTNYSDTTVAPLTIYNYRIRARDAAGNLSGQSARVTITTPAETEPPSAPGSLTATATSATQVSLNWTPATDNVGVTSYEIHRDGSLLGNVAGSVTSYLDNSVLPLTTYDYQVRARDGSGNISDPSNLASTTTPADTTSPTVPKNLAATLVAASRVDLAWSNSTDNVGVTGYDIIRNGNVVTTIGTVTNHSDSTVAPLATYIYKVRARDAAGNVSSASAKVTVTTPADTELPTPPAMVAGTPLSATQVRMGWTPGNDNVAVTGYNLYRDGALLATLGVVTNYIDSTVVQTTTYHYFVRARDGSGNVSDPSNTATVTTPDGTPPTPPSTVNAQPMSETQVQLSWSGASDNVGVTNYDLYRDGAMLGSTGAVTEQTDATVAPATTYSYHVRSRDTAGHVSVPSGTASATTPADTQTPSAPTSLSASPVSGTRIDLLWNAASDNVGVTGYEVYRGGSWLASIAASTGYSDATASPAITYNYVVRARDGSEHLSDPSNAASATTPDTVVPSAPSGLSGAATSATQVDLTWSAATDNVGVAGYEIYRDDGLITAIGVATSFSDTSAGPLTTYAYQVRARDAADNISDASNSAFVTTPADTTAPTTPTNLMAIAATWTQIDLAWEDSTDDVGVVGYDIYRDGVLVVTTGVETNYSDTSASPLTTFEYTVQARDAAGNLSDPSNTATVTTSGDTTPPTPPANLIASAVSATQVDMSWIASTDDVGLGGYNIYRDGALLATIGVVTNYSDTTAEPGTTYDYEARARDDAGNLSDASNAASATTPADTEAPTAPGGLTATALDSAQVDLEWTASTDNVVVTGYQLYRDGAWLASIGATTQFSDTTVAALTTYSYEVRASDSAANLSDPSNAASVQTP